MISSNVRRALHQALDIVVDALNEDASKPAKRSRTVKEPAIPDVPQVANDVAADIDRRLERAGFRKTS
jgi:hypothetical protein